VLLESILCMCVTNFGVIPIEAMMPANAGMLRNVAHGNVNVSNDSNYVWTWIPEFLGFF